MRTISQAAPGLIRRNTPLLFGFFVAVFVSAVWASVQFIVYGRTNGLALLVGAGAAGFAIVFILNDWRKGLYLFLGWLLFEDFARKYLGNNMAIYFVKDLFVALVYLSFFLAYRRGKVRGFRPPFLLPLAIFFWFGLLQVFNPASTSYLYGVLGLKLNFYYVPLMFLGYALLDSETSLRRFFFFNLSFAVVVIGIGVAQAILGHTFLNPAESAADIAKLSDLYRVTPESGLLLYRPNSVFVSAGRFTDYLLVIWPMVLGFGTFLLLKGRRGSPVVLVTMGLTVAAILLSGSRGALLWSGGSALIAAAAFLWGSSWRGGQSFRVARAIQRTLLCGGLVVLFLAAVYPSALRSRLALYAETLLPNSPASELAQRVNNYPLQQLAYAFAYPRWPYGYGIGTSSLGIQYVSRIMKVPPMNIGVESGFGTLVVELGIVGFLLYLLTAIAIAISNWGVVRRLKGTPAFPIGFVIFWYVFLLMLPMVYAGMAQYQDFIMNAYLWLLIGVLFRLPSIPEISAPPTLAPAGAHLGPWTR